MNLKDIYNTSYIFNIQKSAMFKVITLAVTLYLFFLIILILLKGFSQSL